MGTITVLDTINLASKMLDDPNGDRWDSDFHLQSLNDGQRAIVALRPDANAVVDVVQLDAGCYQNVPDDYWALIALRHNMGTGGLTPGRVVERRLPEHLAEVNPYWLTDDTAAEVLYWMYDRRSNPRQYAVYPPQPVSGQGHVEGVFSQLPADVLIGGTLTIGNEFAEALLYFMLARARAVNKESTVDVTMAEKFFQAYMALLGGQAEAEERT